MSSFKELLQELQNLPSTHSSYSSSESLIILILIFHRKHGHILPDNLRISGQIITKTVTIFWTITVTKFILLLINTNQHCKSSTVHLSSKRENFRNSCFTEEVSCYHLVVNEATYEIYVSMR